MNELVVKIKIMLMMMNNHDAVRAFAGCCFQHKNE
jgi:hypothetical protein